MQNNEKGISVVSVLVAVGMMGMLAVTLSSQLKNSFKANEKLIGDIDLVMAKQMVAKSHCSLTLPTGTCTPTDIVELQTTLRNGRVKTTVSSDRTNPTKIGKWTLKAECNSTGDGVIVKAARQKPGKAFSNLEADFFPDPLTGRVQRWQNSPADKRSYLFGPSVDDVCLVTEDLAKVAQKLMGENFEDVPHLEVSTSSRSARSKRNVYNYDYCFLSGYYNECEKCAKDDGKYVRHQCLLKNLGPKQWELRVFGQNSSKGDHSVRTRCYVQCKNFN